MQENIEHRYDSVLSNGLEVIVQKSGYKACVSITEGSPTDVAIMVLKELIVTGAYPRVQTIIVSKPATRQLYYSRTVTVGYQFLVARNRVARDVHIRYNNHRWYAADGTFITEADILDLLKQEREQREAKKVQELHEMIEREKQELHQLRTDLANRVETLDAKEVLSFFITQMERREDLNTVKAFLDEYDNYKEVQ